MGTVDTSEQIQDASGKRSSATPGVPLQYHTVPKRLAWAALDSLFWALALALAMVLRYEFRLSVLLDPQLPWFLATAAVLTTIVGFTLGPYGGRQQWGSFEEILDIARSVMITGAVLLGLTILWEGPEVPIPRSVPIMASFVSLCLMFAARFVKRSWDSYRLARRDAEHRALIFGAGTAGRGLVRSMRLDTSSGYHAVGFIDDDRRLRRRSFDGVRVRGNRGQIEAIAKKMEANTLIVAASHVDGAVMREITQIAQTAGLRLLSVPPVDDVIEGNATSVHDLRDMDLAELLGRRPISLDHRAIAAQLGGKTVLVTGAGGSIGSELSRQIDAFGPRMLYLLDRDETGLQATQMSLTGNGLLTGDQLVLADIRDRERLLEVFRAIQPDIVFHAAALKHLTLLEKHPAEAWKSNVLGTLNVLGAAAEVGVESFINISTDKAASPTCVLGYSKRVAERLTSEFARTHRGRYVSVRFGNVLGSRGSVVQVFTEQIRRGGPITITHRAVTRYFMLIPEACQLVLQAATMGDHGEVMVLDMGEPMAIRELAENLIRRSGRSDIEIVYSGLRPGEKINEDLFGGSEPQHETQHQLVRSVDVPPLHPVELYGAATTDEDLVSWMRREAFVEGTSRVDDRDVTPNGSRATDLTWVTEGDVRTELDPRQGLGSNRTIHD